MKSSEMTQAYTNLLDTLTVVRRSWAIRRAGEGLVFVIAVVLVAWLSAAVIDRVAGFDAAGRWLLWVALLLSATLLLWRRVVLPCTAPHSRDFFAALIETSHPTLRNRVINAVQLGRDPMAGAPRLVQAIVEQAVTLTDEVDVSRAVHSPRLRRMTYWLLAAAVLLGGFILLGGPGARISLQRVTLPWADIPPFSWTTLSMEPANDMTLLEGSPLEVRITSGGLRPATEASLVLIDGRGVRHRQTMKPSGKNGFTHTIPSVNAPLMFYAVADDARTRRVAVAVEPRPRITAMSVTYRLPAYTATEDRLIEKSDGYISGLPGTVATLSIVINKPLGRAAMLIEGLPPIEMSPDQGNTHAWIGSLALTYATEYRLMLTDTLGHQVEAGRYLIGIEADLSPQIAFVKPGRDIQVTSGDTIPFTLIAQDDYGLGPLTMFGRTNPDKPNASTQVLQSWPSEGTPRRRLDLSLERAVTSLGLKPGDRLEYWATVEDRNNVAPRPGFAESRHYHIQVLTSEQIQALLDAQLTEYAKALTEMIRLQRLNRNETAGRAPAGPLVERQSQIRRAARQLADVMENRAFVMKSMIDELRALSVGPMADVIGLLESARDAVDTTASASLLDRSVPLQDRIIVALEEMLRRITRDVAVRASVKTMEQNDPETHRQVTAALTKLARDLDRFLSEQRDIREQHERMAKRDDDETDGEMPDKLKDIEHRLDRWKQWLKDNVDGLAKLPEGFVKDSHLGETLPAIFEEVEKMPRGTTTEIATPLEEGAMVLSTKVLEDLEIWMMHAGDSVKWMMEEGMGGKFDVQPAPLPSDLQDMVGDLIEDLEEFDEGADDTTSTWGGDTAQAGWDIADGPISSFSATGKTGNQLPNSSEITGRSGAGRRGRSSGQMVGDESRGMEGRPTPARVTNEKYEKGIPNASKQLDPRGATGGGKKTGGGARGLQGGTPPEFSREMDRLRQNQSMLREQAQQLAKDIDAAGRSSDRIIRATELLDASEHDLRDYRYDDAARKRKTAIQELKAGQVQLDESVGLSLQKARDLPPDMREQITAGSRQPLPEGFEDLVGAYYKALSSTSELAPPPRPETEKK